MASKDEPYVETMAPRGLQDDEKIQHITSDASLSDETKQTAFDQLRDMYYEHELDFNFPSDLLARAREAIDNENKDPNTENTRKLIDEFNFQKQLALNDSPYPEVN